MHGAGRVKILYWNEFVLELLTIFFIRCSCAFTSIETIYETFPIFVHILLWFPIITIILMWHYHVNNGENKNNEVWKYVKHNLNKRKKMKEKLPIVEIWLKPPINLFVFNAPFLALRAIRLKRVAGQQRTRELERRI